MPIKRRSRLASPGRRREPRSRRRGGRVVVRRAVRSQGWTGEAAVPFSGARSPTARLTRGQANHAECPERVAAGGRFVPANSHERYAARATCLSTQRRACPDLGTHESCGVINQPGQEQRRDGTIDARKRTGSESSTGEGAGCSEVTSIGTPHVPSMRIAVVVDGTSPVDYGRFRCTKLSRRLEPRTIHALDGHRSSHLAGKEKTHNHPRNQSDG